jgi:hypothetical protein
MEEPVAVLLGSGATWASIDTISYDCDDARELSSITIARPHDHARQRVSLHTT